MPVFVVSMYPIVIPKAFIFVTYMDHGSVNKKLMQCESPGESFGSHNHHVTRCPLHCTVCAVLELTQIT